MIDRAPPTPDVKPSFPQPHTVAPLEAAHFMAEGPFAAFDPESIKQEPPRDIDIHRCLDQTTLRQRTLFRSEDQMLRRNRVEKRFDAEAVACKKEVLCLGVKNRQRPHSIEAQQHPSLPGPPSRKDDLSVRLGAEDGAECFELATELKKIVDFAIEGDHVSAVGGQHWLFAAGSGRGGRHPPVAKSHIAFRTEPMSGAVRTPMGEQIR